MDWDSRIGRRITLRDLHILSFAVRWGSMAKAASNLSTTQSVVSDAVANLESALGVRLLDRSPKGVEPTVYAIALLKRSHAVFDELRQAVGEIEALADSVVGEVRVACPEFLAGGLIGHAVECFTRAFPEAGCKIIEADGNSLEFRQLHERKVDLMVARVPLGLSHNDFTIETLFDDPHVVVAGEKSIWANRTQVSLAELIDEPWIFPSSAIVNEVIAESFQAAGLQVPKVKIVSSYLLMRRHLLETGRFLTVLPSSFLGLEGQKSTLRALPVNLNSRVRPVAIIMLRNRSVSPTVTHFIDQLRLTSKDYLARETETKRFSAC